MFLDEHAKREIEQRDRLIKGLMSENIELSDEVVKLKAQLAAKKVTKKKVTKKKVTKKK